jgi:hypothetical protein
MRFHSVKSPRPPVAPFVKTSYLHRLTILPTMTAKNRATQIGKLHTALKKHYKPAPPSPGRPLMEHVLYASLLEDTPADLADEGFAKCEQEYFDWNEVRVTTVTELAEVLSRLPSPIAAAVRLKKNLQSMFETFYNFDIDHLKKENLGKAVAKFESMSGMTPFVLSYLIQHGLGGHAIPIDKSAMRVMWLSGIVTDAEAESGRVPGLERTIAKNRAIEFSSLVHQAGIAFQANPKDKIVWDVLNAVNKDAKALYEQSSETARVAAEAGKAVAAASKSAKAAAAAEKSSAQGESSATGKKVAKATDAASRSAETRKAKDKALSSPPKPTPEKPASGKTASSKGAEKQPSAAKVPPAKSPKAAAKPADAKEKAVVDKAASAKPAPSAKAEAVKPASKKTVAKPAAKAAPAEPEKKASKKSEAVKPASAKSLPADKPASKKAEAKPASKKVSDPKADAAASKEASSTNKKLTKQKPR